MLVTRVVSNKSNNSIENQSAFDICTFWKEVFLLRCFRVRYRGGLGLLPKHGDGSPVSSPDEREREREKPKNKQLSPAGNDPEFPTSGYACVFEAARPPFHGNCDQWHWTLRAERSLFSSLSLTHPVNVPVSGREWRWRAGLAGESFRPWDIRLAVVTPIWARLVFPTEKRKKKHPNKSYY